MSIISDNLIHFLARSDKNNPAKQFEIFRKIFEFGLRTSKVSIKFPDGSSVFNYVVCFTDIPLKECNEHTAIYGKFGIGFKKSYIKNSGGNPARYFVDYAPGQKDIDGTFERRGLPYAGLWKQFQFFKFFNDKLNEDPNFAVFDPNGNELIDHAILKDHVDAMIYILSFEKEMGDLGPARDDTDAIDLYYKEREWRLVPTAVDEAAGILDKNQKVAHYKFNRDDVNMVVVPNEEMRALVLNYFLNIPNENDARMVEFKRNPLPIINYDDLQKW